VTAPPATRFCVAVPRAERLDRFLADQLQLSRTVAARLIAEGAVTVDGVKARASLEPERGALVEVAFPDRPVRRVVPADIPLTLAYEDEELAVVDKPAGLVVHPAPGHWEGTLLNALAAKGLRLAGGAEARPGIVHRLDKDTSGLLVVAKTERSHERLGALLAARRIQRRYALLSWGHLAPGERRIETRLARHPVDRKRVAVVAEGGRHAVTHVGSVARGGAADLCRAALETGRTHQIRVHLLSIGHPVVGDAVYGAGAHRRGDATRGEAEALERAVPRQALHAAWLTLPHPRTGELLDLRSEWPDDLRSGLSIALRDTDLLAHPRPLEYLGFFEPGGVGERS
jgi:23S rRNA pseudouridine1911/1915/1917 synthase